MKKVTEQRERNEVAIGGIGGQGVLLAQRLLVEAAGNIYRYRSGFVNYAGLIRGGKNDATVILSKKEIPAQVLGKVSTAILMHPILFEKYVNMVKPGGKLFVNSSLVKEKVTRNDIQVYQIPALDIVGKKQAILSNLVMLGAYLENEKVYPLEDLEKALEERMSGQAQRGLLRANKEALRKGAEFISSYRS